MFKFFRNIRKKLFTENKFSKYLMYAIGEIVLVVVGILIALSINNWNEDKKNQDIYYGYLIRLKSDVTSIRENIQDVNGLEKELIDLTAYQLSFLSGEISNPNSLKLAASIEFNGSINRYVLMSPTLKELISTGKMSLIKSDTIKNYLFLYDQWISMRSDQKEEWDPWFHKYRSLTRNVLNQKDRSVIDIQFPNGLKNNDSLKAYELVTPKEDMTKRLLEIPGLEGLLQDIYSARWITSIMQEREINQGLVLIKALDEELCRLKPKQCESETYGE